MKIIGIDPSVRYTGFAILVQDRQGVRLVESGVLVLSPKKSIAERVSDFYDFVAKKIHEYDITDIALETPFLGKNAQNFLKLGYLRGILFLLAEKNHNRVREFTPSQIKRAVTGAGGASKEQLARVVARLFPGLTFQRLDETDAISIALCALWRAGR